MLSNTPKGLCESKRHLIFFSGLGPVFSSSSSSQTEKRLLPMKSRSVPPLALAAIQASSIEYDQLSLGTSTTSSSAPASAIPSGLMHHQSASSSRSESPMSDRFCLKCSSMVSLQVRTELKKI